jgi:hypothetical protein
MTSNKVKTFDEIAYRQDLERPGLCTEDAAGLAAKTARICNFGDITPPTISKLPVRQ